MRKPARFAIRLITLLCALLLLAPMVAAAQPADEPPDQPSGLDVRPEPFGDLRDDEPALDAARRGLGHPRLDSALNALVGAAGTPTLTSVAAERGARLEGGQVQVHIVVAEREADTARLRVAELGGAVDGASHDGTLLQALVPVERLVELADSKAVELVRVPEYLHVDRDETPYVGSQTTNGAAALNAPAWHALGHRGEGVKVAVIDAGFIGYTDAIASGDLPATVIVQSFDGRSVASDDVHGTACAEVVYDVAPGTTIYLLKVSTVIDLQEAVTYAMSQGVQVISTSVSWYNVGPGDGTGQLGIEVNRAYSAGIVWVTSAGNNREEHYASDFVSSDGDSLHDFASGQEVNCFGTTDGCFEMSSGRTLTVYLRWADWDAPVNNDYDLSVMRYSNGEWTTIATSQNAQSGAYGQRPTESVTFMTSGDRTMYGVAIRRKSAAVTAVNLDLFSPNASLRYRLAARSLGDLAVSANAITVSAVDVNDPYRLEYYSSAGPRNGLGGTAAGGSMKPDVAAYANVATVAYGTFDLFNGTSAATPHVAGAAALLRGASPSYLTDQTRQFFASRAIDMGPAGMDADYGYGRAWLGTPLSVGEWRRARFDVDLDGRSDIFWRNTGTGENAVWMVRDGGVVAPAGLPRNSDQDWQMVGLGDFNADRRTDILWRHRTRGWNGIWFMSGGSATGSACLPTVPDGGWRIEGTGDFNGDRVSDILWRHATSGNASIWYMNGCSITLAKVLPRVADTEWQIVGTGDFDGNRQADILWRHATRGDNSIWFMQGVEVASRLPTSRLSNTDWQIAGTGDFNGDGRSDILWRHPTVGYNSVWTMSGTALLERVSLPSVTNANVQVAADGDYNGDGLADILWRDATNNNVSLWLMNGRSFNQALPLPYVQDVRWQIIGNAAAGTGIDAGPYVADGAHSAPGAEAQAAEPEEISSMAGMEGAEPSTEPAQLGDNAGASLGDADGRLSLTPDTVLTRVFLPGVQR